MQCSWWEKTTIYHVYPRSFKDTTGNGVGDINGIINKLDYLKQLGVESLWISPIFKSPGIDHGYDISNLYEVDPLLGDIKQVETLIKEVHDRNMYIIFDLVLNHTSTEHSWFKESRSSKDNPKRDWYIWAPGKKNNSLIPPNNWISMTGKKGWTYDKSTNEWYYSSYLNFQPDLNYNNPEVKKEMFNIVEYWLNKGIDGFRLDIFNSIMKDPKLTDNPFYPRLIPTPDNNDYGFLQHKKYNFNLPESVKLAKELRTIVDKYPNKFLIGEVSGDHKTLRNFIGEKLDGLHMVFQFELLHFKFTKRFFYKFLNSMESDFPAPYLPALVYSNHDWGRGISRLKNCEIKSEITALLQLTARGVPVIYYGEEIGMPNHNISIKDSLDPFANSINYVLKWFAKLFNIFIIRDDARSPMQWNGKVSENRGFSLKNVKPWIPTIPKSKGRDVASQNEDSASLLNCYRSLLKLRKKSDVLNRGDLKLIKSNKSILMYERSLNDSSLLIVINFSNKEQNTKLPQKYNKVIYSTTNGSVAIDNNSILNFSGVTGIVCSY